MTSNHDLLDPRLKSPKKPPPPTLGTLDEDGESEWEYEYSATDSETFYVTLDLSKADFKVQEQSKSHTFTPRGPWPVNKASELFLNRRKSAAERSHNSAASSAASSDVERDEVEDDGDDDDQQGMPRESQGKGGNKQRHPGAQKNDGGDGRELERVQILNLHSATPLISYKGRVFSGAWSENTTTELLITPRVETSPLPILRHLDDDVDLLAASAARINVTEKKLGPKYSERERQRASASLPHTMVPPVDPRAAQDRIDQRNFLADLVSVKERKGEPDEVTVIARSMQGKRAKGKAMGVRTHRRGRWAHTNKLHRVRGADERSRRAGRKKGSGRGRGAWALFPLTEPVRDSASVASSAPEGESTVSTPTPFQWDDLEEGQDDSSARLEDLMEVDTDDEHDEDEAGFDDNNDYDEDEDDQGEMDEDED